MKRRMIDPDLLREKLEQRKLSTGKLIQVAYCMDEATVEVEEPVRCHECQRVTVEGGVMRCPIVWADIEPDDYCSFGIRRGCGKDACEL